MAIKRGSTVDELCSLVASCMIVYIHMYLYIATGMHICISQNILQQLILTLPKQRLALIQGNRVQSLSALSLPLQLVLQTAASPSKSRSL